MTQIRVDGARGARSPIKSLPVRARAYAGFSRPVPALIKLGIEGRINPVAGFLFFGGVL